DVHARRAGDGVQAARVERRRVGQPGTVDVEAQPGRVSGVGEGGDLVGRVAGAEFGRLGDGDDAGLRLVGVAEDGQAGGDVVGPELAVRRGHGHELHTEEAFGGAGLVGGDVGGVGADDGVVPAEHEAQADHVRARAVEYREAFSLGAKYLLDALLKRRRPGVAA